MVKTTKELINNFQSYPDIWKSRVIPRLVNVSRFDKDKIPHKIYPFSDTAIVYGFQWLESENSTAFMWLTNDLVEMLYDIYYDFDFDYFAMKNLKNSPYTFVSLMSLIAELCPGMDIDMAPCPMFVLTNPNNMYGASVILRKDVLEKIYAFIGEYYILPSSVHEVIVVPTEVGEPENLREMVTEINGTVVEPHDVLSDGVLIFDGKELRES